ncbi:hypothetical protein RJ641_012753, partial [Dillenia turbinata]
LPSNLRSSFELSISGFWDHHSTEFLSQRSQPWTDLTWNRGLREVSQIEKEKEDQEMWRRSISHFYGAASSGHVCKIHAEELLIFSYILQAAHQVIMKYLRQLSLFYNSKRKLILYKVASLPFGIYLDSGRTVGRGYPAGLCEGEKASDIIWKKTVRKISNSDADSMVDISQEPEEIMGSESGGGFLKLTQTQEWLLGDSSAPNKKKATTRVVQDDSERRRRLNLLNYEALKKELLLLSVGIGTACSGYCLLAFSVQAAVSYAVGVLFSCLYLQLLYKHVDNQKKAKKIGVRREDLRDSFYRFAKGSGVALSSSRLVIPAAIYGLWALSHQHKTSDFFDFQLVPSMLGMFVYKAATLVQVYRDNEDFNFVFPEEREN